MGQGFRNFYCKVERRKKPEPTLPFIKDVPFFLGAVRRGEVRFYFDDIFDRDTFPWTDAWKTFTSCGGYLREHQRQQLEVWAAQLGHPEVSYNSEYL